MRWSSSTADGTIPRRRIQSDRAGLPARTAPHDTVARGVAAANDDRTLPSPAVGSAHDRGYLSGHFIQCRDGRSTQAVAAQAQAAAVAAESGLRLARCRAPPARPGRKSRLCGSRRLFVYGSSTTWARRRVEASVRAGAAGCGRPPLSSLLGAGRGNGGHGPWRPLRDHVGDVEERLSRAFVGGLGGPAGLDDCLAGSDPVGCAVGVVAL
jgi:hypothetical protein